MTLVGKEKVKKGSNKGEKNKKDLSKVKCYGCHEFGHYVNDYPHYKKKGKKQVAASVDAY